MHKDNWDDFRYVLAVAEHGSVSGAARDLKVNHATVLRRVAAFEERYGARMFDRTAQGYSIRGDRLRVIDAMRDVENSILSAQRTIEGNAAPLRGDVRITSTDTFCVGVLPELLARFQPGAAELRISLLCSNDHLDLSRMHADIAVRPAARLPDGLVGQVAARLGFAVYAVPGAPDRWLGLSGAPSRAPAGQWLARQVGAGLAVADSFLVLRQMAARGLGKALLPCILGDQDPTLERQGDVIADAAVDIWVASHPDLADVKRIAAVRDMLVTALAEESDRLAGILT